MADYVVETGSGTDCFYRKWNSGILEIWGVSNSQTSITFPVPFVDNNYAFLQTPRNTNTTMTGSPASVSSTQATPRTWTWNGGNISTAATSWYAIGKWK